MQLDKKNRRHTDKSPFWTPLNQIVVVDYY